MKNINYNGKHSTKTLFGFRECFFEVSARLPMGNSFEVQLEFDKILFAEIGHTRPTKYVQAISREIPDFNCKNVIKDQLRNFDINKLILQSKLIANERVCSLNWDEWWEKHVRFTI